MMDKRRVRWLGLSAIALAVYAVLAACSGSTDQDSEDTSPTPRPTSATPRVTPTSSPSVEEEVSAAYLNYWDVYAAAVFNLDESRLSEVLTGPQLERTRSEIENLRQKGRAAKIVVEHNFFIAELDAVFGEATIRDEYTNRSYEVDAETKEIVGDPAPGTVVTDTYILVKEGEVWKVRDGVRQGD